jgi:hypothetical protein
MGSEAVDTGTEAQDDAGASQRPPGAQAGDGAATPGGATSIADDLSGPGASPDSTPVTIDVATVVGAGMPEDAGPEPTEPDGSEWDDPGGTELAASTAAQSAVRPEVGKTVAMSIGGVSVLKGLVLYAAVLAFASLYVDFIVRIFSASAGKPPTLDTSLVSAAAALAGVLGSAFALSVGSPSDPGSTNAGLHEALTAAAASAKEGSTPPTRSQRSSLLLRRALSLEPSNTTSASWPMTFGIWVYAFVAAAVAVTYAVQPAETPGAVKALAVAFGGYVITLITVAYGITTRSK